MKFKFLQILSLVVFFATVTSCSNDDETIITPPEAKKYQAYILNTGSMGSDNASLSHYNTDGDIVTNGIFKKQNSIDLGNVANDMVIYGSKMYIAVTNSNKIYITDLNGKILKRADKTDAIITPSNAGPRSFATNGNKVYVSLDAGYAAQIDTTSLIIEKEISVGSHPEQMTVVKNKLYVTNSGWGMGTTLSVINLPELTKEQDITVALNPMRIASDAAGNIYVASLGGGGILASLQKIDTNNNAISVIGEYTHLSMQSDKIFLMNEKYDASWVRQPTVFASYNTKTGITTPVTLTIPASEGLNLNDAANISINPNNNDIYVTIPSYSSAKPSVIAIFKADGTYSKKISVEGIASSALYFYK